MAKPVTLPRWSSVSQPNEVVPAAGLMNAGYGLDATPASGEHNWLFRIIYTWLAYLDLLIGGAGVSEALKAADFKNSTAYVETLAAAGLFHPAASGAGASMVASDWLWKQSGNIELGATVQTNLIADLPVKVGDIVTLRIKLRGSAADSVSIDVLEVDNTTNGATSICTGGVGVATTGGGVSDQIFTLFTSYTMLTGKRYIITGTAGGSVNTQRIYWLERTWTR